MAKETPAEYFIGTDHQFVYEILDDDESAAIDVTSWALSWMWKRRASDPDERAVLTKTSGSGIAVAGTYNADPDVNLQRATVTVEDTDTLTVAAGLYVFELKRTDAGFETVLAYGALTVRRGVHR
jgi:hypothetical protein